MWHAVCRFLITANGSAVWVSSFTVNKVKYMISTLIKLFTEDFYERRKVVNELPIQPVIQRVSSSLLLIKLKKRIYENFSCL